MTKNEITPITKGEIRTGNFKLIQEIREMINDSSPLYNFGFSALTNGSGSVGEQCNIYQQFGDWRINISTDANSQAETFAVELSLTDVNKRDFFNKVILQLNSMAKENKAGPCNYLAHAPDGGVILKNYNDKEELTEKGDNGPYIRLAKHRRIRAEKVEIIDRVNDLFIVLSTLTWLTANHI